MSEPFDREAIETRLETEVDRLNSDADTRLALADAAWRDRVEQLKDEINRLTLCLQQANDVFMTTLAGMWPQIDNVLKAAEELRQKADAESFYSECANEVHEVVVAARELKASS